MPASKLCCDPDSSHLPRRKDLPVLSDAPAGAAWIWGADDHLGRLNLLTPARVKAATSLVRTGEIVNLDLPLNVPETPAFGREPFSHDIKALIPGAAYDDCYTMNTQSGSQWDGFRHAAHQATKIFYNGMTESDIVGPDANDRCGISHWADHGIAGTAILLDYKGYAERNGRDYAPNSRHAISLEELRACGAAQGIDIRPEIDGGDIQPGTILLIRSGWVKAYYSQTPEERRRTALRPQDHSPDVESISADKTTYVGVKQEEAMVDWLHDCYFAAVGGDAPTFEAWPPLPTCVLHEFLLALWGCPIGEMFDLEKIAEKCRESGQWEFFFTSSPANCPGGVGSHPNAQAIL